MKKVRYIFPTSHHYRLPFHERLRSRLLQENIEYKVIYSPPSNENVLKSDTVEIEWGLRVKSTAIVKNLLYQHAMREALNCDLAIIQQENRLVLNYLLQIASPLVLPKIAFFGHGRNFQSRNPDGVAERWKRFWATKCDWWFGYTEETRRHIEALGFPPERITVFNNAVDTTALQLMAADLSDSEVSTALDALGVKGANVAIFVGGLYPDKRLDFLIAAADQVRAHIPDFELIVIGGGEAMPRLCELAASRPWVLVAGPRFGREKAALMCGAKLFLMPGLVGLAVLDAAAMSLPVVTTAWPWHSPEVAYLQDGLNGIIVPQWQDTSAYATAIVRLLRDEEERTRLAEAARSTGTRYTIDAMAERFARGVMEALR